MKPRILFNSQARKTADQECSLDHEGGGQSMAGRNSLIRACGMRRAMRPARASLRALRRRVQGSDLGGDDSVPGVRGFMIREIICHYLDRRLPDHVSYDLWSTFDDERL